MELGQNHIRSTRGGRRKAIGTGGSRERCLAGNWYLVITNSRRTGKYRIPSNNILPLIMSAPLLFRKKIKNTSNNQICLISCHFHHFTDHIDDDDVRRRNEPTQILDSVEILFSILVNPLLLNSSFRKFKPDLRGQIRAQ